MTTRFARLCLALVFVATAVSRAGTARAQQLESQRGFSNLGSDSTLGVSAFNVGTIPGSPNGVNVGESTILHAGVGAEAGVDTNVFFDNKNANPVSSPLLRVTPFAGLTNAGRGGAVPGGVFYDLSAFLTYREYLSDDSRAVAQRAFNPVVGGMVEFGHGQNVSFALREQFARFEDPPYGPSSGNITRDHNFASAVLTFAPGGGRLQTSLAYNNAITIFETQSLKYGNNMGHEGVLDVSWKWLPKTAVFLQGAVGYISYLESGLATSSPRANSLPLKVLGGLRGLITNKLSLLIGGGYTTTFFSNNVTNPGGWANLAVATEVSYQPTMLSNLTLGYRRELQNSPVLGQYMNVNAAYAQIRQSIASRLVVTAFARYAIRDFQGIVSAAGTPVPRTDNMLQGGMLVDFFIQEWLFIGASYLGTFNRSNDNRFPTAPGIDYDKHLVLGRLGITY